MHVFLAIYLGHWLKEHGSLQRDRHLADKTTTASAYG